MNIHVDEKLFAALARTAEPEVRKFDMQSLINVEWAFATVVCRSAVPLFIELATVMERRAQDLSSHGLAITSWALVKVDQSDAPVLVVLASMAACRMEEFSPQGLANIA
eukprot:gnl/TRDRNA2_/TRDRNA2_171909_c5_seq1.p2 gnl/TRDRNA2_/TRDRNA2_171909_c5~~gnl/TRDRNA2_/TRDRNA2_171909_c5_seq1.p2  ORF type:complete len:109 (+),score=19.93 gnl/TRDRNA2_/TRDRNA2_171909_c5_seq1:433-759(+)